MSSSNPASLPHTSRQRSFTNSSSTSPASHHPMKSHNTKHYSKNFHKFLLPLTLFFFLYFLYFSYNSFHFRRHTSLVPQYPFISLPRHCDTSKGRWVPDPNAPYYTNTTCFTIQEHQNCMKFGRPDRGFLKWRWKPDDCELSPFDPVRFFELVKGKKMAFVGDSLGRNQMQSLLCLLSKVEYPKDISYNQDPNFKRMYYSSYDFTISTFWSPFLVRAKKTDGVDPKYNFWDLFLDEADKTWTSQLERFDYVFLSTGTWYERPSMYYEKGKLSGCQYCHDGNVTALTLIYAHRIAIRTAFQAINKLKNFKGQVFFRTVSPKHFENGFWDTGGNCVRTKPYRKNQTALEWVDSELYKLQIEEFRKAEALGKQNGVTFRLLDMTEALLLRPDGHPSKYGHLPNQKVEMYNDCVHWCLPGPIDTLNNLLFHMMHPYQDQTERLSAVDA